MRTLIAIALSFALAPAHAAQKDGKDLEKLQGKWESVSVIDDGKPLEKARVKFEVKGDKLTYYVVEGDKITYVKDVVHQLNLDSTKDPMHLDLVEIKGEKKGTVYRGIFKYDGPDGFVLCLAKTGKDTRPKEFKSAEGSGHRLMHFKHAK
jgi:uncharacterized protein (TIGR03067 family)